MPPKKVRGTLMTNAQGQLTTRNIKARYSQVGKAVRNERPEVRETYNGGNTAMAIAKNTTTGV